MNNLIVTLLGIAFFVLPRPSSVSDDWKLWGYNDDTQIYMRECNDNGAEEVQLKLQSEGSVKCFSLNPYGKNIHGVDSWKTHIQTVVGDISFGFLDSGTEKELVYSAFGSDHAITKKMLENHQFYGISFIGATKELLVFDVDLIVPDTDDICPFLIFVGPDKLKILPYYVIWEE